MWRSAGDQGSEEECRRPRRGLGTQPCSTRSSLTERPPLVLGVAVVVTLPFEQKKLTTDCTEFKACA